MDIDTLRSNLSTITDVFFLNRHGREILFFFTQRPFLTSVVFLTLDDTLLTSAPNVNVVRITNTRE